MGAFERELTEVRRKLDSLVSTRLLCPFDQAVERAYERLCEREQELLGRSRTLVAFVAPTA